MFPRPYGEVLTSTMVRWPNPKGIGKRAGMSVNVASQNLALHRANNLIPLKRGTRSDGFTDTMPPHWLPNRRPIFGYNASDFNPVTALHPAPWTITGHITKFHGFFCISWRHRQQARGPFDMLATLQQGSVISSAADRGQAQYDTWQTFQRSTDRRCHQF